MYKPLLKPIRTMSRSGTGRLGPCRPFWLLYARSGLLWLNRYRSRPQML